MQIDALCVYIGIIEDKRTRGEKVAKERKRTGEGRIYKEELPYTRSLARLLALVRRASGIVYTRRTAVVGLMRLVPGQDLWTGRSLYANP